MNAIQWAMVAIGIIAIVVILPRVGKVFMALFGLAVILLVIWSSGYFGFQSFSTQTLFAVRTVLMTIQQIVVNAWRA